MKMRLLTVIETAAFALACAPIAHALEDAGPDLATEFAREVSPRLTLFATLNHVIDRYGLIDADYEQVAQHGRLLWVLRGDRTPVATPGRYLVVVDTQRAALPAWARRP